VKSALPGALFILSVTALAGCVSPMNQREAQGYAATSLRRYCADTTPCAPYRVTQAQRLGDGWMVDFDSATTKYGVMVHNNGNTQVTAWKKEAPLTR
jgi:hypothetical protein